MYLFALPTKSPTNQNCQLYGFGSIYALLTQHLGDMLMRNLSFLPFCTSL